MKSIIYNIHKYNKNMKTKTKILKTLLIFIISCFLFTSCDDVGTSTKKLHGDELDLPDELKGLKVYDVFIGGENFVKVVILDDKVNSTTHQVGKSQQSNIIINKQNKRMIEVTEILVENDSIIVCKK